MPQTPFGLEEEDWQALRRKLTAFARHHFPWFDTAVEGWSVEDLVNHAIQKVISGERRVGHNPGATVFAVLFGTIRSEANHITHQQKGAIEAQRQFMAELEASSRELEETSRDEILRDRLLALVDDDSQLRGIVRLLLANPSLSAKALAGELNCEIRDIYNSYRRLKDRLRKFKQHP